MGRSEKLRQLMQLHDPGGLLPGIPLVEIFGDRRVLIEHHRGVVAYGCCEICVRVTWGVLSVTGSGLNLARMTKDQLVICGAIDGIRLIRGGGQGK